MLLGKKTNPIGRKTDRIDADTKFLPDQGVVFSRAPSHYDASALRCRDNSETPADPVNVWRKAPSRPRPSVKYAVVSGFSWSACLATVK